MHYIIFNYISLISLKFTLTPNMINKLNLSALFLTRVHIRVRYVGKMSKILRCLFTQISLNFISFSKDNKINLIVGNFSPLFHSEKELAPAFF